MAASLLACCVTALAGPARQEANRLYHHGNQQYTRGDYHGALESYRKARMLFSSYKLDYNLARTLDSLGRTTEAAQAFHRFLARADLRRAPVQQAAEARRRLLRLRRKVSSVTLICPPGAVVVLDGKSLGQLPQKHQLYLAPGTHYLSARKGAASSPVARVTLAAGEHKPLELSPGKTALEPRGTGGVPDGPVPATRAQGTPETTVRAASVADGSSPEAVLPTGKHRLVLGLGIGLCMADLERAHALAGHIRAAVDGAGAHQLAESPESCLALNLELSARYLAPYHLLGQLGLGLIYNSATSTYQGSTSGTLSNQNMVLEIPLLVGGHLVLLERLQLVAALGPSVFFAARSYWDAEPGAISDFEAGAGAGFHALLGADWMISSRLGLGLELRYRYLRTGEMRQWGSEEPLASGAILGTDSAETYDLDFSGLMVALNLRFVAL